jgi:hypothetical protein
MAQVDSFNNNKLSPALAPAQLTATATGLTIDTQGYQSLQFMVNATAGTGATLNSSNYFTVQVWAGDASNMSDEAQLTGSEFILGNLTGTAGNFEAVGTKEFGVITDKRYVRIKLVETGTATAQFYAVAGLGASLIKPVTR